MTESAALRLGAPRNELNQRLLMNRTHLGLLLLCLGALGACDNAARSYPTCPTGVTPAEFDCIPATNVGEDSGTIDVGVVDPDTPVSIDASPTDLGVCIPDCSERECGGDGCGGVCGECDRGSACSAGVCVPRGGGGDLECAEIIECVQRCETEQCWEECMSQGTPQARDEFVEILTCFEDECARFQDDPDRYAQCQEEECGDVINACYGAPIGGGDLECGEAIECIFGCRTEECQQECFFQATPEGQEQLQDFFECAGGRCEGVDSVDEWFECTQELCPDEFGMCFEGDDPPPPPEDGCSDRELRRLEELSDELGFIIVECGFSCMGGDDETECASECLADNVDLGEGCSDCLGEFALCIADDCGAFCEDPNAPECQECSESACLEPFYSCAEGF